jgi:hypothetical protein
MDLPPGTVDPMFLCELALELGKSLREIEDSMSAYELSVVWPAFFRQRAEEIERERARQENS